MDGESYFRFLGAMIFVLALMGGLWLGLRKLGLTNSTLTPASKRRLKVIESLPLDARRRAVILQRDGIQHLVILGPTGETVIETEIPIPADEKTT